MKEFLLSAVFSFVAASAQAAVVVPDGYGSLFAQAFDSVLGIKSVSADYPTKTLGVGLSSAGASLNAASSSSVGPSISASAHAYGQTSEHAAGAYGSLGYFFTIAGPADSVLVSILAKGGTTTAQSGTGTNTTGASISITGTINGDIFGSISASANQDQSFRIVQTVSLLTGTLYQVGLGVYAQADTSGGGGPYGSASSFSYVDPIFSIADGVSNPDAYAFTFSPGFSNGSVLSPVPLPNTVDLFGLGLLGLGLLGAMRNLMRERLVQNVVLDERTCMRA